MPALRELATRPTGPAGGIDRHSRLELLQQGEEDAVLEREGAVDLAVVGGGPAVVPPRRRHDRDVVTGSELLGPVEEFADLQDPGPREVPVVLAGEGPQEGDSFETEQVGKRVLVDRVQPRRRRHTKRKLP